MRLRPAVYAGIVAAGALSRLVPHAPNLTPLGALALFAGASFDEEPMAFAVPMAAMLLSDAVLGFRGNMPAVYVSFLLSVLLGRVLRREGHEPGLLDVGAASLWSSTLFYLLTNFSVWAGSDMYPHSAAGLVLCYAMAIPLFGSSLAGGLLYALGLFGAARLADRTVLRLAAAA